MAAFAGPPQAAAAALPTLDQLAGLGLKVKQLNTPAGCLVDMAVDKDPFFYSIGRLQDLGILSKQITYPFAQSHVAAVSLAFGVQASGLVAHMFIEQTRLPGCHFRESLLLNGATIPMFEFDFDRATDAKFDWSAVASGMRPEDVDAFSRMVPNFRLVPAFRDRVQQEMQK